MADIKDILSGSNEQVSNEELLQYLDVNTPEEIKHATEKKLADNDFESDAVEGLQQLKKEQLKRNVSQLNRKLTKQLLARNKSSRTIKDFQWVMLAVMVILFICIITYVIIKML